MTTKDKTVEIVDTETVKQVSKRSQNEQRVFIESS